MTDILSLLQRHRKTNKSQTKTASKNIEPPTPTGSPNEKDASHQKKKTVDPTMDAGIEVITPPQTTPVKQINRKKRVSIESTENHSVTEKHPKKKAKTATKQSHFNTSSIAKTVCPECHMSYLPHLKPDVQLHDRFHQHALMGLEVGSNFGKLIEEKKIKDGLEGKIVEVNIESAREVQIAKEFLDLVNTNLNAPADTSKWMLDTNLGKVFLFIVNGRAVGLCSTERVSSGYWMVHETGNLVPGRQIPLLVGISRVYVSHKYRRMGIGMLLLRAVREHSIYGMVLKKFQVGWSQPTEFGGLLAKITSGVLHPSGKTLIPVYKEEEEEGEEGTREKLGRKEKVC